MIKAVIFTDGGARGNPGPAAAGAVILDPTTQSPLAEISKYLGETTNNQAEYQALILALEKALSIGIAQADCYLDSELIVKQLAGIYRVKHPDLKPLYEKVREYRNQMQLRFYHVRRERNAHADSLVNQAIDAHLRIIKSNQSPPG